MKHAVTAIVLCISMGIQAQNVGIGTSSPNANAKLDITATDKGVLIPRMDSVHRKAIPGTIGLLVYDSTTKSFWYNNGAAWQNMAISAPGWSLTGNSGIDTSVNFLGTTDDQPLIFKVNNEPAGKIKFGLVSIGTSAYSGEATQIVAIGGGALSHNLPFSNSTIGGFANTAIGEASLYSSINSQDATAVGAFSLNRSINCTGCTVMGSQAMSNNVSGHKNTVMGAYAMSQGNGSSNTCIGSDALAGLSGDENTVVGASGMNNLGTGSHNTAVGFQAMSNVLSGTNNTSIGYKADLSAISTVISNATAIGANAKVDASNKIRLGDENVTVVESNGVFNTVSDGRFKYNIHENVKGLDFIMQLRPVTYQFDAKKQEDFTKGIISAAQLNSHAIPAAYNEHAYNENNGIKRTGFIAQEVEAAAQKTGFDFDGVKIPATDKQYYSLSYASFVVPLVKAMQEQQQVIDTLKKQNELLQQQNELAQQQNEMIIKRLKALEKK